MAKAAPTRIVWRVQEPSAILGNVSAYGLIMPRLSTVSLVALAVAAGGCGAYAQDAPPQPAMMAVMKVPVEKSRAAIAECRQRRERGEFKTYRESAACSNPRIFAAWREANYPHMDLITAWLNAREEGSDKVDQHNLAPREFEEQMAALTVRLTAEEQRRRAGLIVA